MDTKTIRLKTIKDRKNISSKNSEIFDICGYANENILYLWGNCFQKILIFILRRGIMSV